eukprot:TRINITY_DN3557_c0_g1_i7.p1 TRINITY_DN3557_c0_g1~~TRINITY_DN3557_c0_g1_i7.p1  ORF type:complete len:149 (+),score=50.36 TRINITY_DN3557_c0_g1_i7:65-511(+)
MCIRDSIHRVGRTARAGKEGASLTICNDKERIKLKQILKKHKDEVYKRQLNIDLVKKCQEKIKEIEKDIENIFKEEYQEQQVRKADDYSKKRGKMSKQKDGNDDQPVRGWFISEEEKQKIKDQSKAEFFNLENEVMGKKAFKKKVKKD